MKTAKSIILVMYYGLRIKYTAFLSAALIILGFMMIVSSFNSDNPIRLICVCTGIFSVYFGSVKSLNK
jgi:hypothetical protein